MLAGQFLPRLALLISVVSWWLGWGWEIRTALHTCLAVGLLSAFKRRLTDWSGLVYVVVVTAQRHQEHRQA